MSDIPELDQLLAEADIVRRNREWERMDRLFRRTAGYFLLSCLLILPCGILFGKIGAVVAAGCAVLSVTPVFIIAVGVLLHACFKDPPQRDMTRRYTYK